MPNGIVNWNSRLVVKFIVPGVTEDIITPINNFTPTAELPKDVIDSIDGYNLGYSHGNARYGFTFEVTAVNKVEFMRLFAVGFGGARFSISIATKDNESDDWVFDSILMDDCVVVDCTPVDIDNSGKAPTMKFTGKSLSMRVSRGDYTMTTNNTNGADSNGEDLMKTGA